MKQLFLSLLLLFSFSVYADKEKILGTMELNDKTTGCKTITKILSNYYEYHNDGPMIAKYRNHGFIFKEDLDNYSNYYKTSNKKWIIPEKIKFKRKANGNIIVSDIVDMNKVNAGLSINSEILKLNDKPVSTISDEEIIDLMSLEEIKVEFESITPDENSTKVINSIKKDYGYSEIDIALKEQIITNIDSKKSEHSANIDISTKYYMAARAFPVVELIRKAIEKEAIVPKGMELGFSCSLTEEQFEKTKLYNPKINISNQTNILSTIAQNLQYKLSFFRTGTLTVIKNFSIIDGTFKDNFKFQSFPFDAQSLKYEIGLVNDGQASVENVLFSPEYGAYTFLSGIEDIELNEWKKAGADYKNTIESLGGYDINNVTFYHNIERNYSYYLFKIILPIIIILFISWSVLWIRPKEIEARLTVSIVCLLSLIAYTFIIDKDIPKLSYLTIMDYVVLVSYFFSVLPTIQTIFVHNYINKKTNKAGLEYAKKIDNIAIKAIPAAYFIILFLIFNEVVTGNLYTIKSFSF